MSATTAPLALLETVRAAVRAGFCVVPPCEDGSKKPLSAPLFLDDDDRLTARDTGRPALNDDGRQRYGWGPFQREHPPNDLLEGWYIRQNRTGIGLICGAISRGLELFEFEERAVFDAFGEAAERAGLGQVWRRVKAGYLEDTPGGGVHTFYLSAEVEGNIKLAMRPKRAEEMKDPKDLWATLIETRGEGGYAVIAPSNGRVHPTRGAYRLVAGGIDTIETIMPEERESLHALARTFNQQPSNEFTIPRASDGGGWELLPGDDFNARGDWERDILGPAGWTFVRQEGERRHYKRPGKTEPGWSGNVKDDLFHCFTSSTLLTVDKTYNKFTAFAVLFHRGNFSDAAAALASKGYGKRREQARESVVPGRDRRPFTDLGNGERMIDRCGQDIRYCHLWGRWLVWTGARWKEDDTGAVDRVAYDTARHIKDELEGIDDPDKRKVIYAHAMRSESAGKLQAMTRLAQSLPGVAVRPDDLDADPWLLNVENGAVDLRTGHLRAHRRADLISKLAPVAYDPTATCPTWDAALARVLPDEAVRLFFQRLIGYVLTGSIKEQVLPILWGSGSNGKSTLLGALQRLLGDYATEADPATFMQQKHEGVRDDLADLKGARLVATTETNEGRRIDEALVKRVTGGERIKARKLYGDLFEYTPTFKVLMATNHKPVIRDTTLSIWRRVKLIPFTVTIGDAEKDADLPEKLQAEWPGILRWAIEGCLAWQRDGLGTPDAVAQATSDYRAGEDILGTFIDDRCIPSPTASTPAKALYQAYRTWCEDAGEQPMTGTAFGRRMQDRPDIRKAKTRTGWFYIGLGLAHGSQPEASP